MAIDPVCGMTVDQRKAAGTSQYRGQTYYFCSTGCKAAFDKDPEKYVAEGSHKHSLTLVIANLAGVPVRSFEWVLPIR